MPITWKATQNVWDLVSEVKLKHHDQRLSQASIAVSFSDSKPFIKDRFNWGNVSRFSGFNKIWMNTKHDFCIQICSDVWSAILTTEQKEALIDLHLSRCAAEYIPEVIVENDKKVVVKDQWGRVQYTNEVKLDDEGNPKWRVLPLDLIVFTQNVGRYGLWCNELNDFKQAIVEI